MECPDGYISTEEGSSSCTICPAGTYEYNKTLSQSRADNVKEYCLSSSTGLNKEMIKQLSGLMQSVGRSSDELIVDKKGKEDAKASRRVTFRFTINLNGV